MTAVPWRGAGSLAWTVPGGPSPPDERPGPTSPVLPWQWQWPLQPLSDRDVGGRLCESGSRSMLLAARMQ